MLDFGYYNMDCFDGFKLIDDKSVDMILCDLPYGTTQNEWDSVIPLYPLWEQYKRIIKDNGTVALFSQMPFTIDLIISNRQNFKYQIIWEKTIAGGFLNARRRPLTAHETINIFCKTTTKYNPQMQIGERYLKKAVSNGDGKCYGKFERIGNVSVNDGTRFPRDVIKFSNGNYKSVHSTQKPVPLLEYLIKTYTDIGDLVLDNCAGSCSTGIAAYNTGRNFIGFEKDEDIYERGNRRYKQETAQMNIYDFMGGETE